MANVDEFGKITWDNEVEGISGEKYDKSLISPYPISKQRDLNQKIGKTYNDVDIKIVPLTNKLTLTYDTGKEMKEIVTVPGEDGAKDEQVESIQYETIDGITKPKTKKTTKEYDWNKENVTTLVTQLVKGDPQFSDGEEKAISKQVEKVVVYLMKNHFTSKSIDPNSGDISSGLMSDLNNAESNVDTEEYEDFVE